MSIASCLDMCKFDSSYGTLARTSNNRLIGIKIEESEKVSILLGRLHQSREESYENIKLNCGRTVL